jgi:hypothetical protein
VIQHLHLRGKGKRIQPQHPIGAVNGEYAQPGQEAKQLFVFALGRFNDRKANALFRQMPEQFTGDRCFASAGSADDQPMCAKTVEIDLHRQRGHPAHMNDVPQQSLTVGRR